MLWNTFLVNSVRLEFIHSLSAKNKRNNYLKLVYKEFAIASPYHYHNHLVVDVAYLKHKVKWHRHMLQYRKHLCRWWYAKSFSVHYDWKYYSSRIEEHLYLLCFQLTQAIHQALRVRPFSSCYLVGLYWSVYEAHLLGIWDRKIMWLVDCLSCKYYRCKFSNSERGPLLFQYQ